MRRRIPRTGIDTSWRAHFRHADSAADLSVALALCALPTLACMWIVFQLLKAFHIWLPSWLVVLPAAALGVYLVREWAMARRANRSGERRVGDREGILRLSPREYESFVARLFRADGWWAFENRGREVAADGGIDIRLERATEVWLVQCKNWRAHQVNVGEVRAFYGVVAAAGASGGYFITSSTFTHDAVTWAASVPKDRPLVLIDGRQLVDWTRQGRSRKRTRAAAAAIWLVGVVERPAGWLLEWSMQIGPLRAAAVGLVVTAVVTALTRSFLDAVLYLGLTVVIAGAAHWMLWLDGQALAGAESIDALRRLSSREFADLVAASCRRQGYRLRELKSLGDSKWMYRAERSGERVLVFCVHEKQAARITAEHVIALRGRVAAESLPGLLVTMGVVAERLKFELAGAGIDVVDGRSLHRFLRQDLARAESTA